MVCVHFTAENGAHPTNEDEKQFQALRLTMFPCGFQALSRIPNQMYRSAKYSLRYLVMFHPE